jgi:hypothetical protein
MGGPARIFLGDLKRDSLNTGSMRRRHQTEVAIASYYGNNSNHQSINNLGIVIVGMDRDNLVLRRGSVVILTKSLVQK